MSKMDTSGHKGWWPVKFYEGKNPDGSTKTSEGFKNVLNNQEVIPEKGWNAEPPYPTGDLSNCRHVSEKYRENYDNIQWGPPVVVLPCQVHRVNLSKERS